MHHAPSWGVSKLRLGLRPTVVMWGGGGAEPGTGGRRTETDGLGGGDSPTLGRGLFFTVTLFGDTTRPSPPLERPLGLLLAVFGWSASKKKSRKNQEKKKKPGKSCIGIAGIRVGGGVRLCRFGSGAALTAGVVLFSTLGEAGDA